MPSSVSTPDLTAALAVHYEELVRYVRGRFAGPGPSIAREVVHDVCVELMEQPPAQAVHAPLAFFRRVCVNRAIDRRRADATRGAFIEFVGELPDIHVHVHDGASVLDFEQQLAALVAVVEAMPSRARQCFLLHKIHGMTHEAIACEIGITRGMVTQHLRRALDQIVRDWAPAQEYL